MASEPLLEIKDLTKRFPVAASGSLLRREQVTAIERANLAVEAGRTMGLVGESGSGKTTIGRTVVRLTQPDSGEIRYAGRNILKLSPREFRQVQPDIQMVFQDPYSTLNPRLTLRQIIGEPMKINRSLIEEDIEERTSRLAEVVGLKPSQMDRYPHEFSGGQRQRIAISRALALNPRLIICDEAVSALDVSIQAKILNLLMDLQQKFGPAYLFISHDLSVVRLISDSIAVMYLGRIMEIGPAAELTDCPLHPYTRALLAAVPDPYLRERIQTLKGEIPGNVNLPSGCRFHTRCPEVMPRCSEEVPALAEAAPGRTVACFLHHNRCE